MINHILHKICELSKPCEETDFLPTILGKHYYDVIRGNTSVVMYGAGYMGERLCKGLEMKNIRIASFCDNNPEIVNRQCSGHPVISVEELKKSHPGSLVVVSDSLPYVQQSKDILSKFGITGNQIHTPPLDSMLYYSNAVKLHWSHADLEEHATKLQNTYDLFFDQKSKHLFVQRMALLAGAIDYNSFKRFIQSFGDFISKSSPKLFSNPRYDENHFYFFSEFFPLKNNEVFSNVGALVGDCAIEFVSACKQKGYQYKEIINFEPDPDNFKKLSANMNHIANVKCLPYGLWSSKARLRFSNPNQSNVGAPGWLDKNGSLEVEVDSLDHLLPDAEISFIKMDVEGAELEALRGAANTIRKNTPKLAISVYHNRNDIFEIPLFIHQIHPGYKFYLRHHSTTFSETVLFAIQ
jgi:FkbM family methyltransferase